MQCRRWFARGEAVMAISARKLTQLIERHESGQVLDSDLDAFLENPTLWRKPQVAASGTEASSSAIITPESAQLFWQFVWDEVLGADKVPVPLMPKLTSKQVKSLERFGFMLMYLPAITEEQYPDGFVKPDWKPYLTVSDIERKPLTGTWVAVETIMKPDRNDPRGYPKDRLMAAVKHPKRFGTSRDDLTGGLLEKIAKATGFPKKGTRLPTAEEWNLVGNLFNWLTAHRSLNLPDLGSTRSWEWCDSACGSSYRFLIGMGYGGLADVHSYWLDGRLASIAFRVLVVL